MAMLYANENFPLKAVQALRALGHDVLTSQEAGKANLSIPDIEVLAFAAEQGRALLTINRKDFSHLHQREDKHEGIIVCTQDSDIQGLTERIHENISGIDSLSNQLIRINRPQR